MKLEGRNMDALIIAALTVLGFAGCMVIDALSDWVYREIAKAKDRDRSIIMREFE